MIDSVHHLAFAVASLAEAQPRYERAFGAEEVDRLSTPELEIVYLQAGSVVLELLEPLTEDSALGRFVRDRGEGLHHLAFGVADAGAALAEAGERGMEPLDPAPKPGGRGTTVAFARPPLAGVPDVQFVQDP
jgi:methylmalonyl-CoA/ethylmalonyl-CoA epimerase